MGRPYLDSRSWPVWAGLVSTALVLLATSRYGPALTPDSWAYFAAARSLADGRGLLLVNGQPMVDYAPMLSVMLAFPERVGIDSAVAVRFLNAVLLGLAVVISSRWLGTLVGSRAILAVGVFALVASKPLVFVSSQALSEVLFITLSLVALLLLDRYDRTGGVPAVFGAAAAVGGAWTTRYIGVTLVATGTTLLLMRGWQRGSRRAIVLAVVFLAISACPVGLWLVHNYLLTGTLTGVRPATISTLAENLHSAFTTLSLWALPIRVPGPWRISLVLGGVAAIVVGVIWAGRARSQDAGHGRNERIPAALLLFVLLYFVTVLVLSTIMNIDSPNQRYLAPIYIPLVLLGASAVDHILTGARASLSRPANVLGSFIVTASLLWIVHPVWQLKGFVQDAVADGAGYYSTTSWVESDLMQVVRQAEFDSAVFSNAADAVYLLTGRTDIKGVPRKRYGKSTVSVESEIDEFRRVVAASGHVYLAWFQISGRIYLYTPADLATEFSLRPAIVAADGTVFAVQPAAP